MKNYVQPGNVITVAAPGTAGVSAGDPVLIGSIFGVAATDADAGDPVELAVVGVFSLPKAAEDISAGDALYYDETTGELTATADTDAAVLVGYATAAALTAAATVNARLIGQAITV